jgi:hypothetical protein
VPARDQLQAPRTNAADDDIDARFERILTAEGLR